MKLTRFARNVVLALLFVPSAAFADSIDVFVNTGGTLTYSPVTQTLTLTSTITELINQYGQVQNGNFGILTVTTGPLISGSIDHHALFSTGTISIDDVIGGTLDSLIWYQVPHSDEFHLAGSGQVGSTPIVNFDQLVVLSGANQFEVLEGRVGLLPEPSTISMLTTGLALFSGAGVARIQRRRITNRVLTLRKQAE